MNTYKKYEIISAHNVRDLGGYKIENNKVTKSGRFVQSDSLHRIHKTGIISLVEKNLSTLIDLRTTKEVQEEPNLLAELHGVNFLNLPLLEELSPKFLGNVPFLHGQITRYWHFIFQPCMSGKLQSKRFFQ